MKKQGKAKADNSESANETYKVLLHNDDRTSMEFVVLVLQAIFDKPDKEAEKLMLQVHEEGQATAGEYPLDMARAKVLAVKIMARANGYPLACSVEGLDCAPKTSGVGSKQHAVPKGWIMAGSNPNDYSVHTDMAVAHSGTRSVCMEQAIDFPEGFGTVMQQMLPDDYLGKRLRLKMWVKTENVNHRVQPWMRVDGPDRPNMHRGKMLAFDNYCDRSIEGTTDWSECSIVLNVPESATNIAFGILMSGRGKVWMDDVALEPVDKTVPATDCPCLSRGKPKNLSFEEE